MAHTSGPWRVDTLPGYATELIATAGETVAVFDTDPKPEDAKIIAAAPEMLSVVRTAASIGFHTIPGQLVCRCGRCDLVREARAALAKATT